MWESTADDNSLIVAQIFEFLDGGREDALSSLVDPRYVNHDTNRTGIDGIRSGRDLLRSAFGRDARVLVQAVIAEGDEVAVRWTLRGRQPGDGQGTLWPARPIELSALSMFRLEDGRVVESWQHAGAPHPVGELGSVAKSPGG
jgi:predicted ester cyclase